jgi:CDP-diacylglycerol---glycerol-3-phosphate 3-phosphatidyltransferase
LAVESSLAGLRRGGRARFVAGGVVIASAAALVAWESRTSVALAWGALAMGVWLYQAVFIRRRLGMNHRPGETTLLTEFGPGAEATIVRGWLLACLAGFLLFRRPSGLLVWAPAAIYMLADVADYLDGYLARISDHVTLLGETLDIEYDAMGLLVAALVAVHYSALPAWFFPVGLARYAFIFGLWSRRRAGKPIYPLPPSDSRRPLAGLQMGALGVILVPVIRPPVTTLGGVLLAVPLLIGFARDWLVVSGAVDPDSDGYQRLRGGLKRLFLRWMPLPLRAAAIVAAVRLGGLGAVSGGTRLADGFWAALWLAGLVASAAVALGFAPRISALILLATLLMRAAGGATSPELLVALTAAVSLLMVGGGALSIWQPELRWFRHRAGEKQVFE